MSDSVRPHKRQLTRLPRPWDSPRKNTGVGYHFLLQCMKVKRKSEVAQSCLTLHDPMDCSLPGSSAHGIFQARVLEWGAIPVLPSRPGVLWFMGSQRVGHDWVTELNWTELKGCLIYVSRVQIIVETIIITEKLIMTCISVSLVSCKAFTIKRNYLTTALN